MMEQQNESKEWNPNPQKHESAWMKMWYDIIDSRRWSIRQTHGDECAKLYEPVEEEQAFFMAYGKLPHNAVGMKTNPKSTEWLQPPCEKCDQQMAQAIVKIVDSYHDRFWKSADRKFADKRKRYEDRLAKQRKETEATEQYKADKDTRKQLEDYLSPFIAKLKADGKADNEAGHKGKQAATDGAAEADSKEADTNTATQ